MPHWVWNFFTTDGSKFNITNKNLWCTAELTPVIKSLEEEDRLAMSRHEIDAPRSEKDLMAEGTVQNTSIQVLGQSRVICSKLDTMLRHIRDKCTYASPELKQKAFQELEKRKPTKASTVAPPTTTALAGNISILGPNGSNAVASTQRFLNNSGPQPTVLLVPAPTSEARFLPTQQEEFAADLVYLFSACGIPFSAANHPILKNFFAKYVPGARVPCRQVLAGRVLDEQVCKAEGSVARHTEGKLAMGQCDGWKNVSRTPVIAVMMTVEQHAYLLQVHNVGAASKTAENLVEIMRMNMEFAATKYKVEWIGWCTDAGGDARKARKLAFEAYPWLICPDCWAHQTHLIVGDYFKLNLNFMGAASQAQTVVKWFNNHSRALGILRDQQTHTLGKTLALIFPVVTRWTSVYQCLRRLIECFRPLRAIAASQKDALLLAGGKTPKAKQVASEVLGILNHEQFWIDITCIIFHLAPLAIASHVTQAASTRLDHVLLTMGNLHRIYRAMSASHPDVGEGLCASIEKRWAACDQDVFILGVFFNPFIRGDLFAKSNIDMNPAGLFSLVLRVWARVFQKPCDSVPSGLRRATIDYYGRKEEFSDDRMHLKLAADEAQEQGKDIDIVDIWQQLDTNCFKSGRNWLVKLAIRILSVVANSAGCERLFSAMGLIHTKTRNRLILERVRKSVYLKTVLQREQELLGWTTPRLKRKIDVAIPAQTPRDQSLPDSEIEDDIAVPEDTPVEAGAQLLMKEAAEDVDDEPHTSTFGRPGRIQLAELFAFPTSAGPASTQGGFSMKYVEDLWATGLTNMDTDLELLEMLQSDLETEFDEDVHAAA